MRLKKDDDDDSGLCRGGKEAAGRLNVKCCSLISARRVADDSTDAKNSLIPCLLAVCRLHCHRQRQLQRLCLD